MKKLCKQAISALLALLMLVSMLPLEALALEPETATEHVHDDSCVHDETSEAHDGTETDTLLREMADILALFGVLDGADDEALLAAVSAVDDETFTLAAERMQALDAHFAALSEDESAALAESDSTAETYARLYGILTEMYGVEEAAVTKLSITNLEISFSYGSLGNGDGNLIQNDSSVSFTGKGLSKYYARSYTITIKNTSGKKLNISFDIANSGFASVSPSGSVSQALEAGGTITISVTTPKSTSTCTLTLSNFKTEEVKNTVHVKIIYDDTLGSVTGVTNGGTVAVDTGTGFTPTATPNSGVTFLGWRDTSTSQYYAPGTVIKPGTEMTLEAAFARANTKAWFWDKNKTYLSNDPGSFTNPILAADGTLLSGNYTIPSGSTLLIPFDDANTLYTNEPGHMDQNSYSTPRAYRTLTMASSACITVNGAMSLSAKYFSAHSPSQGAGSPSGNVSFVNMEAGSTITVNNGGKLYAWGYITGSENASVVAESGAEVFEFFQFNDFRGGTQTVQMKNRVFPLSQYYVQNIEVPLTLKYGASESAYTGFHMSIGGDLGHDVTFIGPQDSYMFTLTSGYLIKRYDGKTDRLVVDAYGDVAISGIKMEVGSIYGSIDSSDYELPINSNIDITVHSGTISIGQNIAMLPGSSITIEKDAACKLGSGKSVFVYDADEWGSYVGSGNKKLLPILYAPSKTYTRTEKDLIDATIRVNGGTLDASEGYIYTTAGGANLCGAEGGTARILAGTATTTYQLVYNGDPEYPTIPITPAKLKNADGKYIQSGTDTYTYIGGHWRCTNHKDDAGTSITEPTCTEPGETKYTCTVCGYAHTAPVDATGHPEDQVTSHPAKPASCTEVGQKAYYYCAACKKYYDTATNKETIPENQKLDKLSHTLTKTDAVPSTCTSEGNTAYWTCSVCGKYFSDANGSTEIQKDSWLLDKAAHKWAKATCTLPKTCSDCHTTEGSANGHDWADATCTEPKTCIGCDATEGEALGHDWADATCTEPKTCKRCKNTEGNANGHKWDDATCTTPKTCSVCKETDGKALGHDWKKATCTEPKTCKRCKKTVGNANGHDWDDATCTTPKTCSVCGETEGSANGHDFTGMTVTYTWTDYATCVAAQQCKNCTHKRTASTAGQYGNISWRTTKPATCTETGTDTYTATFIGEASWAGTATKDKTCSALGHKTAKTPYKAATCIDDGTNAYWYCSQCTTYFSDGACTTETTVAASKIAATGHHYGTTQYAWTNSNLTCTATRTCANAGCSDKVDGHTQTASGTVSHSEKTAATCKTKGWTTYTALFSVDWAVTQTQAVQDIAINNANHESAAFTYENKGTTHEKKYACCSAIAATENHAYVSGSCVCGAGQSFTITWIFGTETKTTNVNYDATPAAPFTADQLKKDADKDNHYTFAGWAASSNGTALTAIPAATENAIYYAVFTAEAHSTDPAAKDPDKRHDCVTCGYLNVTDHTYTLESCTEPATCTLCGAVKPGSSAKGHKHDTVTRYTWEEKDGQMTCTAISVCTNQSGSTACTHTLQATVTPTAEEVKAPTCGDAGETKYTATFAPSVFPTADGWNITTTKTDSHTVYPVALGHTEGTVRYEWAQITGGGWKCTAIKPCGRTGCTYTYGTETVSASSAVAQAATCTEAGNTTYTAVFKAGWAQTQTKTVIGDIPAKEHRWSVSYDWTQDKTTKAWHCTAAHTCQNDAAHNETATATVSGSVTTPATCTAMGKTTYTATFTETWAKTQTKTETDVVMLAHSFGATTYAWTQNADGKWQCKATRACGGSGCIYHEDETVTEGSEKVTVSVLTPATCEGTGSHTLTASFEKEWAGTSTTEPMTIAALGHDMVSTSKVEPTCTTDGHSSGSACSRCGHTEGETTLPAPGHNWKVEYTWNTDHKTCIASAACQRENCGATDSQTVNASHTHADASCTAKGSDTYTAVFSKEWVNAVNKTVTKVIPIDKLPHTYSTQASDSLYSPASCTEAAKYYLKCDKCGTASADATNIIAVGEPTPHSFTGKASQSKKSDATCASAALYYLQCDNCSAVSESDAIPVGSPLEHDYTGVTVRYDWTQDDKTGAWNCTAKRICKRGTCGYEDTDSAIDITPTVDTPATCTEEGKTKYTALFKAGSWASTTEKVETDIPKAEHTPDGGTITQSPFYSRTGTRTYRCTKCDAFIRNETIPATGKLNISVLGDSITAFTNYSNGDAAGTANTTLAGGRVWFPMQGKDSEGNVSTKGEITEAEHIWIYRAAAELDANILVNNSWSGSAVQFWQYGAPGIWQDRCVQLHDNTGENAGQEPDIIAVYMGTNDFKWVEGITGQSAVDENGQPVTPHLGTYEDTMAKVASCTLTVDSTPTTTMDAYWISFTKMQARYPNSEIFVLGLLPFKAGKQQPVAFNDAIQKMSVHFGVTFIDLEQIGIDSDNKTFEYLMEDWLHPNLKGMEALSNAFVTALRKGSSLVGNSGYVDVSYALDGVVALEGTSRMAKTGEGFTANLKLKDTDKPLQVTVTMGGTDITESCFTANYDMGTRYGTVGRVNIANVTGEISITAVAHKHSYTPKVTDPTCTKQGYTTYSCACGHSYDANFTDALEHSFTTKASKTLVTPASCTKAAIYKVQCDRCDELSPEKTIPVGSANGHRYESGRYQAEAAVPATCTARAKHYAMCDICNNVDKTRALIEVGEPLPHSYGTPACTWTQDEVTQAWSCTAVRTCTTCPSGREPATQTAFSVQVTGERTKEPTCTQAGTTTYTAAFNEAWAGSPTYPVNDIPASDHRFGTVSYSWTQDEATGAWLCTASRTCTVTGCGVSEQAHGTVTFRIHTQPNCTEKGKTEYSVTAFDRSWADKKDAAPHVVEDINALQHEWNKVHFDWKKDTNGAWTCTASRVCKRNNTHIQSAEAVSVESAQTSAATCVAAEKLHLTAHFAENDAWASAAETTVDGAPASGHSYGKTAYAWTQDSKTLVWSCTATRTCPNCAEAVMGHSESRTATVSGVQSLDPTCNEKGKTTYTAQFSFDAGVTPWAQTQTRTETDIPAAGHNYAATQYVWSKDENGIWNACTATRTCPNCAETADGHTQQVSSVSVGAQTTLYATCAAEGETTYTAKFDPKHAWAKTQQNTLPIAASGHLWNTIQYSWSVDKTVCTASRTCQRANCAYHTAAQRAVSSRVQTDTDEATCEKAGSTVYTAYFTFEAGEEAWVTEQTLTIPAEKLPHMYGDVAYTWTKDKTSGKWSCTASRECTRTGCTDKVAGHSESVSAQISSSITKKAACEEDGETTYTATFYVDWAKTSDTTKTVKVVADIPKNGHSPVKDPGQAPSCSSTGKTDGSHCSVCGTVIVAQTDLPMTAHTPVPHEGKKPTYTTPGYEPYVTCKFCDYTTYQAIPALGEASIETYDEFLTALAQLESWAQQYARQNPGKDPISLVIKYIRTGVDRYNSGSWNIMAKYEDEGFAKYVTEQEDAANAQIESQSDYLKVSGLKNLENFVLSNGNEVDFGHMFGTMDISWTNKNSVNHADVGGWAGDLVDLMSASDRAYNDSEESTLHLALPADFETMVTQVREQIFMKSTCEDDKFSETDFYGDLDGLYLVQSLSALSDDYTAGDMTRLIREWCTASLSDTVRAEFFLSNRLGTSGTRTQIREAIYTAFTGNNVITTLEGTRTFLQTDSAYLEKLRKASCYAFADYICQLAGDYVDVTENPYYTDFHVETSTLAPGVIQEIHTASTADNKQIVYYLATADLTSPYVDVYANYNNCNPTEWKMTRVLDQAEAAQSKYGEPGSADYIQNYQVVAAINADGFNMATGEPSGLLIMDGTEYHSVNSNGFFGITKTGKAVIGTTAEYNSTYKNTLRDAVGGFGTMLVVDGEIAVTPDSSYYNNRNPRTAVGITRTGKVVFMVLDGRQEPVSCGGSMQEIAQIMREAGCVDAINLDGGGSTTYVSKPEGSDALEVTSKPSDGYARSVSSTLMIVSTAPSSTAFDHARLDSDYDYVCVGSEAAITATGVSATGNIAELPSGCTWAVEDTSVGSISAGGVFTGLALGQTDVLLLHEGEEIGRTTMHVVVPTSLYFTRTNINVVYGASAELPIAALYDGKRVAIRPDDVSFRVTPADGGSVSGFTFTAAAESALKLATVTASLAANASVSGSLTVNLFRQGDMTFDFDSATAGDRQLAWVREVSNAATTDDVNYTAIDHTQGMEVSYIFAMDMTQIPIPAQLNDLVYMLPGADDDNASAWNFLLQLAQRVSSLTEVRPVFKIDPRFDVDYSELKVVTEYFELNSELSGFNEQTNELTLVLNWKRQSKSIDAEEANPLCLLNDLKLTPKDGNFDRISNAVNVVDISYTIYLSANALYSFAQNPENQKAFGLYPFSNTFVNESGKTVLEQGGYLATDYKRNVHDQFSLSRSLKQGWVYEGAGYAYYVDGEKLTGVAQADGCYYDFGADGINVGKTKFSGTFNDDAGLHLARNGELLTSGWNLWNDRMYHCHSDGIAKLANVTTTASCVQSGYKRYYCTKCRQQKYSTTIMPTGHDWDEDHVCKVCGTKGKNIEDSDVIAAFGRVSKPYGSGPVYFTYQGTSVNAAAYVSVDNNKTALTQSNDATLNSDGSMRDIFVQWTNNKAPGVAKVILTGRGNYYGTRELEYRIMPGTSTLSVAAKTTNSITLSWTEAAGGATYYEVYYYLGANQYRRIDNVSGTSLTVEGLSPDTTYSFAICAHKELTGQTISSINSPWSNIVSETTNRVPGKIITFDANGGTTATASSETGSDGKLSALPDATREGFSFDGWFTVATGGTKVTTQTVFTADTTLYAHWTKNDEPDDRPVNTPTAPSVPTTPGTDSKPTQQKLLPFVDVAKSDWFYADIAYVYEHGIMNGSDSTHFSPNSPLTRGMIVTILYRAENEPDVSDASRFADVASGQWYARAVSWAEQNGIVTGYGNGRFGPNDPVTREQLAAIFYRYAAYRRRQTDTDAGSLNGFTDAEQVSAYAAPAMRWAVGVGLLNGSYGRLSPAAQATRAQVAAMIRRFLQS